jgi:NrS-1  polymerase HBD domain
VSGITDRPRLLMSVSQPTAEANARPQALPVLSEHIPPELRERPQWVVWSYELRDDKWTKVPHTPGTDEGANPTGPSTWRSYAEALTHHRAGRADGIGYVFAADDPFCGIDLDKCRDPQTGALAEWARKIIGQINSYAELSPSGTGVKLFAVAVKLSERCKTKYQGGAVEMYDRARFFTVTGQIVAGAPPTVEARQTAVEAVYELVFGAKTHKKNGSTGSSQPPPLTDAEILDRLASAKNRAKFQRLYSGDATGYASASEADEALACLIAFYTINPDQILRLIRGSKLGDRDKWEREDYAQRTIGRALELVTEHYQPRRKPRTSEPAAPMVAAEEAKPPNAPTWPPPAVVVLCDWLRSTYQPTFRRGRLLYSAKLGREVSSSEASACPTSEVLALLAVQTDRPTVRGSTDVDKQALPYHFRTWLPVAWGDLAKDLPEESDSAEAVEPAREEFVRRLSAALLTMVPLSYAYSTGEGERVEVQRRPLVEWARMFARGPRWESVRGYRVWSRRDGDGVRMAIRAELLGQLHARDLGSISQRRLSELSVLYGIGNPCQVAGGAARAVELTPDYLVDLLAGPIDTPTQERQTHAPACEAASERHGHGDYPYAPTT